MMKRREKAKRQVRTVLLCLLLLSFAFFATIVTLRLNRSAHWHVAKNYQEQIFYADIIQTRIISLWQSDDKDYQAAERLLIDGFFSPQYTVAGIIIIRDLADNGHRQSQLRYSDIITRGYDIDENGLLLIGQKNPEKARYYLEIADNKE